ncbi:MAG: DUF4080 domain-containing protein [Firmicutes bacterium]|nr:DUF4080 domain-containing protein [Bacillota bacterium]
MKTVIISICAKNIHKALAPWCLKSYCEDKGLFSIGIIEVNVNDNINEIIGKIYKSKPDIAAFSCYIWNIDYVRKIGIVIKKLLPNIKIILGGPEVSFETDLCNYLFSDYIIRGAGEETFFELIYDIQNNIVRNKIIDGICGDFNDFPSPYTDEYFESFKNNQIPSIENRLIYYESSRGCPFCCSYCLSSAFDGVHCLFIERVKKDLLLLIDKGAKCIKFVDRTFNAKKARAKEILTFIYSLVTDCTFHFEAAADLFDKELLRIIEKMPAGRIQFEIGIQSTNQSTLSAIGRKTDTALALKNIKKLTSFSNCHIHVDLIAGLPEETVSSFSKAVNRCVNCKPHMLQLGFLKMLKGTKIREENNFGAVFSEFAPYEVYQTDTLTFDDIIKLKRIESIIERFYNGGMFDATINYAFRLFKTPYAFFEKFSKYCGADNLNYKVSVKNAYTALLNFLLPFGDKNEIEHNIKLDCLSFDSKGQLPDGIKPIRDKQAELKLRTSIKKHTNFRIEFFEFESKHKLFVYENRHIITGKFEVRDIAVENL